MSHTPRGADHPYSWIAEFFENLTSEILGLLCLLLGGFWLLTLIGGGDGDAPWIAAATGWVAPWVTLSTLTLGAVLILGRRAGYWSAEALVGAQLLLLSLMAGAFLANHRVVDWSPPFDGRDGGFVGWALGSLLVSGLGWWPALLFILLVGAVGAGLLLRYTPLIYIAAFVLALVPELADAWERRRQRRAIEASQAIHTPAPPFQANAAPATAGPASPQPDPDPDQTAASTSTRPATEPFRPKPTKARKPARKPGELPPIDLLTPDAGHYGNADQREMTQRIEQTLEDFNVPARVVHVESGPTVTQFGVEPLYIERGGQRRKIRVSRIVNLADDLALALEAPAIRMEAPVPGRPYVGIEVPNVQKTMVSLRGIIDSPEWRSQGGQLSVGLGRDTSGKPVIMDLARAPHLLIAGATGAGKSVCINTIVTSLLMQHGPESLRFLMVDPKMVELPGYNGIPHLLGRVVTEMEQVMGMLTWLLLQMDDRYRLFKEHGVRNIDAYNEKVRRLRRKDAPQPLPFLVLVIDELADLMMTAADDIERQICRLAQMARATGIHLILATQRPSTDVVTGLIKANFPTRIAFAVTSNTDSRVILDAVGAERLLGRGDMLLMRSDTAKLQRVQGCFVSDEEINKVVDFWKAQPAESAESGDETQNGAQRPVVPPWNSLLDRLDDDEELILDAIDVLREMETCSTSMLQRTLRVGYPKAARLMEELESRKIVGPDLGGGQGRAVLLKPEEAEDETEEDLME